MILLVGFALRGVDNAAHIGGAIAGAVIALLWRRGLRYSPLRRNATLGACSLVLLLTFGRVVERDVTSPLSLMTTEERLSAAKQLLRQGDCHDATIYAESAHRLRPNDPETTETKNAIDDSCAR
jgi:hypothetical protein